MKARPFLAVLLALGLLALTLGGAGWWLVGQRGPLALQHRAASLPRAARFVPRQAPLSLYLLSDGEEPVAYARAVAPARNRRQAAGAIERLRDGAFAAAGLDYPTELASWLAPEIGLALFDLPEGDSGAAAGSGNWLLALRSRDRDGARRFVQRFWQTRSLAGTDLQVSRYRGMGLISGRGALLGRQPLPLATALVDDDLLLIASGRGVLEQALDVSQIDELNQGADPALRQRIADLGEGAALLVARSAGLAEGLGIPVDPGPAAQVLARLRPDGPSLWLEALVDRPGADSAAADGLDATSLAVRRALVAAAPAATERLGLLQNPAALLSDPLLRPLVERVAALASGAGPLPPLLVAAADGPLVVAEAPELSEPSEHVNVPAGDSVQLPGAVLGASSFEGSTVMTT